MKIYLSYDKPRDVLILLSFIILWLWFMLSVARWVIGGGRWPLLSKTFPFSRAGIHKKLKWKSILWISIEDNTFSSSLSEAIENDYWLLRPKWFFRLLGLKPIAIPLAALRIGSNQKLSHIIIPNSKVRIPCDLTNSDVCRAKHK